MPGGDWACRPCSCRKVHRMRFLESDISSLGGKKKIHRLTDMQNYAIRGVSSTSHPYPAPSFSATATISCPPHPAPPDTNPSSMLAVCPWASRPASLFSVIHLTSQGHGGDVSL